MEYIYMILGIVLIISVIFLTVVITRFFEHYRETLKQADLTIRIAESSIKEIDKLIDLFTSRFVDLEKFFNELSKTGQNLELLNVTFGDFLSITKKYPKGIVSSLFMLNKIDGIKYLPKLFNLVDFDEELNSMLRDFIKGAIVGGLAVAFLTPKTGEEMRRDALVKLDELKEKAKNINVEDVRDSIFAKIDELKEFITTSKKEDIIERIFEELKALFEKIKQFLPTSPDKNDIFEIDAK